MLGPSLVQPVEQEFREETPPPNRLASSVGA